MLGRLKFVPDYRLRQVLETIVQELRLTHIKIDRVYIVWSKGSRTTALARIWGIPSPFIKLRICEPTYVIELVVEKFSKLSCDEMIETIVHELLHIPRSFSGGLRSHGEWSKKKNLKRVMKTLNKPVRDDLCKLIQESLKEII